MKSVTYEETLFDIDDAIINDEFPGFKEDYLILHSLIRKYKPKTFFEIGTSVGMGTTIIYNAGNEMAVYSLDLPIELADNKERSGTNVKFPYTQLRGDSQTFDFSKYPCEGYFCDASHDYTQVNKEIFEVAKFANIIIWHDTNIKEVMDAILFTIDQDEFDLFRVVGTRISYAIRK